jgi:guanine deaminase
LHERLFAWMTLADDRNLVAAFVAGKPRYRRSADPAILTRSR